MGCDVCLQDDLERHGGTHGRAHESAEALGPLMGVPSVAWCYPYQDDPKVLKVYADSDWAGDLESRRSTTAMLELLGSHPIDCCSVTQGPIALSSGEAELEAMDRGAAGGLKTRAILKGFGVEVE